jgi:TonB-linked SusC/RagA family outer membrane protein
MLTVFANFAFAQVKGTVMDAKTGEALIGASVVLSGTATGVVTDVNGAFSIDAKQGDVLEISYTGYTPQSVTVGSGDLNVRLEQGVLVDEVVVTGYSSQRKRDITGAVSVVTSDDLNVVPAASMGQKLAGKAAGVTISTSGQPGDGTAIRIRGFNSLLNNDPLIVIDGVQTKDAFLNSINPNDIESIQVLKDAASAAIYGARGSNGVIIITTKKGKKGGAKVSYNGYVGTQSPVNRLDLVVDPSQYREYVQAAASATAGGVIPDFYDGNGNGTNGFPEYYHGDPSLPYAYDGVQNLMKPNTNGTDWWDEVINPASITEHNLNVSGGSDNSTFSITGNYYNQNGTILNSYFERFTARANSSFKTGRFTFGENISLSHINQVGQAGGNQSEQNVITNIIRTQSVVPVLDEGGNFAGPKAIGMGLGNNPVKIADDDKTDEGTFNRVFGNVFGEVDIIEGLSARTSLGFDYGTGFTQNATFPNFEAREINQRIFNYSESWFNNFTWISTTTVNYSKTFGVHSLNAVAGFEANSFRTRNIGGSLANYFVFGTDSRYLNTALADPETRSVGSGGAATRYTSYFGQVNYSFDDWLLFTGSLRRDASSVFGPDNRVGIFPAASLGIRLTKWLSLDNVDDLKIRASYGVAGNDAIRSDNAFDIFGGGTTSSFYDINGTNNSIVTGYALTARGNAAGKWEELKQFNVGFDGSFMNGKLGFVLDVYNKITDDLLFTAAVPGTNGSAAPAATNVASMQNRGFDLQLTYRDRISNQMGFNVDLTLGSYRNEILKISDSQTQFFSNSGTRIGVITVNRVGEAIGSFYGYQTDGIFANQSEVDAHADQSGKAIGRIRFRDQNDDGVIDDEDRVILGTLHPTLTGGLRIGFTYGDLDFSTFLFGVYGNEIFNFNKLFTDFSQFEANIRQEVYDNSWSPTNTNTNIPAPDYDGRAVNAQPSDYYVEDGSYLRMESLQIGYTLRNIPNMAGTSLRIYVQGQNLFTLTNYSGIDPAMSNFGRSDIEAGVDFGNYPSNRVLMFGVNLNF